MRVNAQNSPKLKYFDNAASAPLADSVLRRMEEVFALPGNPASIHSQGVKAALEVEKARNLIAASIAADPEEIFFTSGGTEANNWALKGCAFKRGNKTRILVSAIEHPSVLETARWLEDEGFAELETIPVDREGFLKLEALEKMLVKETTLVSVIHGNNEVGTLQPIERIAELCHGRGALFHTDACQSHMKVPIDVKKTGIDLMTLNAHKLHGPKGVGALFIRKGVSLAPLFHGGGHEHGMRSGTLNAGAIAGFAEAVKSYTDTEREKLAGLKGRFVSALKARVPEFRLHSPEKSLATVVNIAIPGLFSKTLLQELDKSGYQVSTSSACHSALLTPSHVLKEMGYSDEEANEAVRVSFGRFSTLEEAEALAQAIAEVAEVNRHG